MLRKGYTMIQELKYVYELRYGICGLDVDLFGLEVPMISVWENY